MDWDAEGLLDGLEADERAAREELLDRLHDQGVTLEELRAAVAEDRLVLLPVERLLGGRYTADEVEEQTGIPAPPAAADPAPERAAGGRRRTTACSARRTWRWAARRSCSSRPG